MKTKAILAFVLAGAMSFTACTKKIDPKVVADINQFGTDWTALGEKATSWSTELAETTTKAKEFTAQQTEKMNAMTSPKDAAMKTQIAAVVATATENSTKLEGMQNEFNTFKATWDATTQQFGEWKDKAMKGEVSPEEVTKGLADFQTKYAEAQTAVEGWGTQYAAIKSSTDQNVASVEPVTAPTEAPVKK